jgi:hypothetical protein
MKKQKPSFDAVTRHFQEQKRQRERAEKRWKREDEREKWDDEQWEKELERRGKGDLHNFWRENKDVLIVGIIVGIVVGIIVGIILMGLPKIIPLMMKVVPYIKGVILK